MQNWSAWDTSAWTSRRMKNNSMRTYIYADESGNFDFSLNAGASRYFILATVLMRDLSVENKLLELRRELAWEGVELKNGFHASTDKQNVRDRVFQILGGHDFKVDATILEKRKAQPLIRPTDERFYKHAWFFHMRRIAPWVASSAEQLMVVAASLGNRREQARYLSAIQDVMNQTVPTSDQKVAMWPADSDPCLQVADYCSWAIQRKWERSDTRSYELIQDKVVMENDLFNVGTALYY